MVGEKIMPCPFCGGDADLDCFDEFTKFDWIVLCGDDDCRGGYIHDDTTGDSAEYAVEIWNKRV